MYRQYNDRRRLITIRKGQTMGTNSVALRRYEDDLSVGGFGVIILGAWDVLKLFMQIIMDWDEISDFGAESEADKLPMAIVLIVIVAFIMLIAFLIFKIHLYIGMNASRAAKGQPYKKGYYTWAIVLLVLSVLSMAAYIDEITDLENIETTIASIIVDLTMIYCLGIVVFSTRKIKEIREVQQNSIQTQE